MNNTLQDFTDDEIATLKRNAVKIYDHALRKHTAMALGYYTQKKLPTPIFLNVPKRGGVESFYAQLLNFFMRTLPECGILFSPLSHEDGRITIEMFSVPLEVPNPPDLEAMTAAMDRFDLRDAMHAYPHLNIQRLCESPKQRNALLAPFQPWQARTVEERIEKAWGIAPRSV